MIGTKVSREFSLAYLIAGAEYERLIWLNSEEVEGMRPNYKYWNMLQMRFRFLNARACELFPPFQSPFV